jgi:hypothetical protein
MRIPAANRISTTNAVLRVRKDKTGDRSFTQKYKFLGLGFQGS